MCRSINKDLILNCIELFYKLFPVFLECNAELDYGKYDIGIGTQGEHFIEVTALGTRTALPDNGITSCSQYRDCFRAVLSGDLTLNKTRE